MSAKYIMFAHKLLRSKTLRSSVHELLIFLGPSHPQQDKNTLQNSSNKFHKNHIYEPIWKTVHTTIDVSLLFDCGEKVQKKMKNYKLIFSLYKIYFWQFSIMTKMCGHYKFFLKIHFNVPLPSNCRQKVLKSLKRLCTNKSESVLYL